MYDFDFSRGTLSVNFHPAVRAKYVTTLSSDSITISVKATNNVAERLRPHTPQPLRTMRQLLVECYLVLIQKHIQIRLIDK